jgi:hypothetical protein
MKFDNIQVGEILSTTMYVHVQPYGKHSDSIDVKDSFGRSFKVQGKKLIEESFNSSEQYENEETVTKTKAAEILTGAGDSVFTVVYTKQDGSERTLVGRLMDTENLMGRSNVIDLQIQTGNPLRQVDHRTIKSIILKGTKYIVKK